MIPFSKHIISYLFWGEELKEPFIGPAAWHLSKCRTVREPRLPRCQADKAREANAVHGCCTYCRLGDYLSLFKIHVCMLLLLFVYVIVDVCLFAGWGILKHPGLEQEMDDVDPEQLLVDRRLMFYWLCAAYSCLLFVCVYCYFIMVCICLAPCRRTSRTPPWDARPSGLDARPWPTISLIMLISLCCSVVYLVLCIICLDLWYSVRC